MKFNLNGQVNSENKFRNLIIENKQRFYYPY
jgi:hypothetical protein